MVEKILSQTAGLDVDRLEGGVGSREGLNPWFGGWVLLAGPWVLQMGREEGGNGVGRRCQYGGNGWEVYRGIVDVKKWPFMC